MYSPRICAYIDRFRSKLHSRGLNSDCHASNLTGHPPKHTSPGNPSAFIPVVSPKDVLIDIKKHSPEDKYVSRVFNSLEKKKVIENGCYIQTKHRVRNSIIDIYSYKSQCRFSVFVFFLDNADYDVTYIMT